MKLQDKFKLLLKLKLYSQIGSLGHQTFKNYFKKNIWFHRGFFKVRKLYLHKIADKIVGWALVVEYISRIDVWIYVAKSHRRKGIGRSLYQKAIAKNGPLSYYSCSENKGFWKKVTKK